MPTSHDDRPTRMKWDAKNAVGAGDAEIGGERDGQAAADRGAVYRGDHRLRQLVDGEHQLGEVFLGHLDEPHRTAVARW